MWFTLSPDIGRPGIPRTGHADTPLHCLRFRTRSEGNLPGLVILPSPASGPYHAVRFAATAIERFGHREGRSGS